MSRDFAELGAWIGVAAALLASTSCQKATTAPMEVPVVRAYVIRAGAGPGQEPLRYSAVMEPDKRVEMAFRVGGYVTRLRSLEPGNAVRKGELLAAIRPTDYRARVEQSRGVMAEAGAAREVARAQLEQTRAQLKQAALDWERAKVLFQAGAMTKPDYDAAESRWTALQAQAAAAEASIGRESARGAQAQADIQNAQVSLDETELRAPFDAVVVSRAIEMGTLAVAGNTALVLADISRIKTVFGVPDVDLSKVQLGRKLPVQSDALPGETLAGVVNSIAPSPDERSRTYSVQLLIANPRQRLKPGMIASVAFEAGPARPQAGLEIPLTALVRAKADDSAFGVYRLDGNGQTRSIHLQPVELSSIAGAMARIGGGVRAGEQIVEAGGSQLADGQRVTVSQ